MATTAKNNILKSGRRRMYPVLSTGGDFNQGDLLYFDSSAHAVKAAGSDANCQYLVGVAGISNPMTPTPFGTAVYPSPLTGAVEEGAIAYLNVTAGETYYHGTEVSWATDAQTITTVGGSYPVGKIWLGSSVAAVTGVAGATIPVLVYNRYEAGAIQTA
jgi:predicted RecA/RadA family phage recombinase